MPSIEKDKNITVQSLLKKFPNEILYLGDISSNKIFSPSWNRAGLELASNSPLSCFTFIRSIIFWGTDECFFLNLLGSNAKRTKAIERVFKLCPPLIILCDGFNYASLVTEIAAKYKTTVVSSKFNSHQLYFSLSGWINEQLASYQTIHGTVVYMNGVGILIQGDSGIGKSEIALQLLKRGAVFVADDAVDITNINSQLLAKPNQIAKTFMEVRGIGIINVARMFGVLKIRKQCIIDIVINLSKVEKLSQKYFERVGQKQTFITLSNVNIPFYNIPVTIGRDISDMIEAVVGDFKLKQEGYNSANEFIQHVKQIQSKK